MGVEKLFQNLDELDYERATRWFDTLRRPEKDRLAQTMSVLYNTPLSLHSGDEQSEHADDIALIVAGTSIDTETYTDIDLFVLTKDPLRETYEQRATRNPHEFRNPSSLFYMRLHDPLPNHTYIIAYPLGKPEMEMQPQQLVESGQGAVITLSLFYELRGAQQVRQGKPDDLIEPIRPWLGAEGIIEHNQNRQAKFLVLGRTYPL